LITVVGTFVCVRADAGGARWRGTWPIKGFAACAVSERLAVNQGACNGPSSRSKRRQVACSSTSPWVNGSGRGCRFGLTDGLMDVEVDAEQQQRPKDDRQQR
jgi:hypothetical protein